MTAPPLLVLVGADKGGVGKTTAARLVLEYAGTLGVTPRVVDTQPAPGILRRFYTAAELVDVGKVGGQMAVMDRPAPVTVVDVRAGLLLPVLLSLRDHGLFAKDAGLRFLVLHLVGPSHASFSEIEPVHALLGASAHVLVRSYVSADSIYDWRDDLLPTVTVPHLDDLAVLATDAEGVQYEAFVRAARSRVLCGAVRHWLDQVYPEFARVGLADMLS